MNTTRFTNIDTMWTHALLSVIRHGRELHSRAGATREILGYSATLQDPTYSFLCSPIRKLSAVYAAAETLWYLSGTNDVSALLHYAPSYKRFVDSGNIAYGGYGPRIMSQIDKIVNTLREAHNSRQAVITIFNANDLGVSTKDLPCTLSLQYILRDDHLHAITNMRSNDLWLGFPYDVFAFTCIQRIIADTLHVGVGSYTHNVGSLHIYQKDYEKCEKAARQTYVVHGNKEWIYSSTIETAKFTGYDFSRVHSAIDMAHTFNQATGFYTSASMLSDLMKCVAVKWCEEEYIREPASSALKLGVRYYVDSRRDRLSGQDNTGS